MEEDLIRSNMYLAETNRRLVEAMGMHWANETRKMNNETPAYGEDDFLSLAQP